MLRWVAACSHIFTFIAGTTSTGLSVASIIVVPRSSAMPAAILAIRSAVAGQTTTRSACRLSSMWPISASFLRSHSEVWTWLPESAARLIGVTNCDPPSVSTQVTSPPPLRTRRTSSQAL